MSQTNFKEFNDLISALKKIQSTEQAMIEDDTLAFSDVFTKFISSQPADISEGLTAIKKAGEDQVAIMTKLSETMKCLPNDLKCLDVLFGEYLTKQNEYYQKNDAAQRSKVAVQKAEDNLGKLKMKGKPADIATAEQNLAAAKDKCTADAQALEEAEVSFHKYTEEYKVRFVETFVTAFSAIISTRQKTISELESVAQAVKNGIELVHHFDDPVIANFEKRYADLENTTIE